MAGETKISDLIKEIRQSDLILPEFQRGYVWDRNQVRSFMTSLYRAYPTGSFLIWKTPTLGAATAGRHRGRRRVVADSLGAQPDRRGSPRGEPAGGAPGCQGSRL